MKKTLRMCTVPALIAAAFLPAASMAEIAPGHNLEASARVVHFDDNLHSPDDYNQTALGLQLNYSSPYWSNIIGFDASGYGLVKLGENGKDTTQLLGLSGSGEVRDGYATLGQAYLKLKYQDQFGMKIGRQFQDSLLLKSTTTRALPDTYSGISAQMAPANGLKVYGAVYDQWRARTTGEFEKFRTESATNISGGQSGDIQYVGLVGASFTNGPIMINGEYLNSKNYLSKVGLVGSYTLGLAEKGALVLSGGIHLSRDAGGLFVCGAEKEVDCGVGMAKGTRINNNGQGIYVDANWKYRELTLGAAVATFDGLWIEDSFAANGPTSATTITDHGTSPFPTSASLGPDLTNNQETVWSLRLGYDWKNYVPGLTTGFKYARGTGARNSFDTSLGSATENYRELDVRYMIPAIKNLGVRYVYMYYNADKTGVLNAIPKTFEIQNRLYVDYSYKF